MDSGAVDVKHDPKVNGYASQDRKAVDKGPVGRFQRDLTNGGDTREESYLYLKRHKSCVRARATDLQVDGKNKGRGCDHGQGLVIRGGFAVLAHGLKEGSIRDEEDDEGDKDSVGQTDEEVPEVEQRPLLTRQVEVWEFQAKLVIHVLEEQE